MKKNIVSLCSFFLVLVFFSSGISVALAQDDGDDSDIFMLEPIIVTAAKAGEQDLQKVAIAMEVITGADFASAAKANVDDILEGLSNVFINTNSDGMRISIRGIADTDPVYGGQKFSSPTVAMNVDGAYNAMNTTGQNLFDVERIEILMGPQSTLYSSNSPGGVVNIVTAAPKTDKFSGNVSLEYGSFSHSVLQAALNAPIIKDKVATRLSLNRTREDSFLDGKDELATKNDAARLKVLWSVTDDFDMTLIGNYAKNANRGEMGDSVVQFITSSDDAWTEAPNAGGGPGGSAGDNQLEQVTKGGSANINWNTPMGNLTVVPSYSEADSSGAQTGSITLGPPGPPGTPGQEIKQGSWDSKRVQTQEGAEARMASPEDLSFKYVLGATYYKNKFDSAETYEEAFSSQDRWNKMDSKQTAVYANVTYPLPFKEELSVVAGFRYSWDDAHQVSFQPGRGNDETEMNVSNPDIKVGFQYDPSDNMMFYGNYSSSFRTDSQAMSNNVGVRPAEELTAYTLGAKTRIFDNRVQVNTSAFYYDYQNKFAQDSSSRGNFTQDVLESHYLPDGTSYYDSIDKTFPPDIIDGVPYYAVMDAGFNGWGDARSFGLDLSVSWIVSEKDKVEVAASYLNMEWTDLEFIYLYTDFFPNHNYDGRTGPNAPKYSMTANYEHRFELGGYGTLVPHVDVQYRSKFDLIFDQSNDPGYGRQEAYSLWNASIAFNSASQKWSVSGIVKNIGNYAVKRSYDKEQQTLRIGDPRTYSVTASVKF